MTSQYNNNSDNNEHLFQEENHQFRPVFFDTSKRVSTTNSTQDPNHIKRARLDSTAGTTDDVPVPVPVTVDSNEKIEATVDHNSMIIDAVISAVDSSSNNNFEATFKHQNLPNFVSTPGCSTPTLNEEKRSKIHNNNLKKYISKSKIRKFRSKSLPNIIFNSQSSDQFYQKLNKDINKNFQKDLFPSPLPPVNIQSLREIDLSEILKNPQLRHDILFDPQLQFRPNLDGERGRRKKLTYEKYWNSIKDEIEELYLNSKPFNSVNSRLPTLFTTLREILLSLLPSKDKQSVYDVLDLELLNQQLSKNSLDFVCLANWLSSIFKSHCAPMRDSWVDEMLSKFNEAEEKKSVSKLVEGLRMIFTILEAMKLDVANHQIRILRPVLIETAVEFERDYFMQMISRCKLDISDSINWFKNNDKELKLNNNEISPSKVLISSVLNLLSCSKMVSEFPSCLAFDHSRLIVLRANVRQLVCLQICSVLYRQLVLSNNSSKDKLNKKSLNLLKKEIMAIVTDDDGNIKWTRNIGSIALQIVRRSMDDENKIPNDSQINMAFNWLIKQTQPSSQVYSLMELKTFNIIKEKIDELELNSNPLNSNSNSIKDLTNLIPVSGSDNAINLKSNDTAKEDDEDDINGVSSRIALLCKFHWNVFGSYYI